MTGTSAGQPVDQNVVLTEDVLIYKLNNGANFTLFNVVERFREARESDPLFTRPIPSDEFGAR